MADDQDLTENDKNLELLNAMADRLVEKNKQLQAEVDRLRRLVFEFEWWVISFCTCGNDRAVYPEQHAGDCFARQGLMQIRESAKRI